MFLYLGDVTVSAGPPGCPVSSPLVTQKLGASWSQESVCPARADSACRLWDFSFLTSGICVR